MTNKQALEGQIATWRRKLADHEAALSDAGALAVAGDTAGAQPTGASNARYVRFEELAETNWSHPEHRIPSNARHVRFEELAANRRQPTTDPSTDSLRPVKPPKSAALATNQVQRGVFRVSVGHAGRGVTA